MKKMRKQLAFHQTGNTLKSTTSCSNPPNHSSPHSSTGDGGAWDDNTKKSSSSTSSSLGDTRNPDSPAHRDPTSPAPVPAPASKWPSPNEHPHSPPPANEEGSLPASEVAGKDPWERSTAARKATASCSCRSIQRLVSEDLKKGSGGTRHLSRCLPRIRRNPIRGGRGGTLGSARKIPLGVSGEGRQRNPLIQGSSQRGCDVVCNDPQFLW